MSERVEVLPYGTVEREAREDGDRIYTIAELPELLEELKAFKLDPYGERPAEAYPAPPEVIDTLEGLAEEIFERAQLT